MAAVKKSTALYKGGEEGIHMLPGILLNFQEGIWWFGTQGELIVSMTTCKTSVKGSATRG
eukprot:12598231-Ditylum_brightwellii.AAC.1